MEGMESKNPMVRLSIYARMKRMVQDYRRQKVTEIDKRLLRGIFMKNIKDFDEDYNEHASK